MKVGIFLDLRNPALWRRPWREHYRQVIDQVVEAERLGLDAVWLTEHHFFEDGYLPQPLVFAAALAARTDRVRIGTAIVLGALRHPVHLAEEAALVDLVSGGRLELGFGAGWSRTEYSAFGVDISRRYSLTDAALVEVRRLLAEVVTPPPVQRPVPLWLGYQGPKGARRAGRLGAGLLTLERASLEPYRAGLVEGGHDPASARLGGMVEIILADDPDDVARRVLPYYAYQQNTYRSARAAGTGSEPELLSVEALTRDLSERGRIGGLRVLGVDAAAELIKERTAGLPVEHVYLWGSIAGMPDDLAARHVELLCTELRPALA